MTEQLAKREYARRENVTQICEKNSHRTSTVLSPDLGKVGPNCYRRITLNLTNLTRSSVKRCEQFGEDALYKSTFYITFYELVDAFMR